MTESEGESVYDMTEALRKLERLFLRQNEYIWTKPSLRIHAAIDMASAPDLKSSTKLKPFSAY